MDQPVFIIQVPLGGLPDPASASAEHAPPHEDTRTQERFQPKIPSTLGTHELVLRDNKKGKFIYLFRSLCLCQEQSPGLLVRQESLQRLQPHKGFTPMILETKWQKKPEVKGRQCSQAMHQSCNPTFSQVSLGMIYEG